MDDSPGSDRPLKRVKYAQQDEQPIVTLPVVNMATGAIRSDDVPGSVSEAPFDTTPWSLQPGLPSPSQMLLTLSDDFNGTWVPVIPASQHAGLDIELLPAPSQLPPLPHQNPQQSRLPRLLPARAPHPSDAPAQPRDSLPPRRPPKTLLSPFTDPEDRLIPSASPRYVRPENGQVNGYVKFNWPSRRPSIRPPGSEPYLNGVVEEVVLDSSQQSTMSHSPTTSFINIGPMSMTPMTGVGTLSPSFSEPAWGMVPSPPMSSVSPVSLPESSMQLVPNMTNNEPRMLPPHFGYQAKMDTMDRRLWDFYIKNWCPGRSVLANTNLWLKDFAQMQQNDGIRAAIQSLAGVYIYDYLPDERIRQRINERYVRADVHFSNLLAAPESFEVGKGNEVVTMAVILSMQDIVLTERRLKKPFQPRWLVGFKQGEQILQQTDPGSRFWKDNNIQLDSLRISQSIIVGRAVILAQPMMSLPSPETLVPEEEASRFGWLLYGTEKDMYEIHGGCGFSKKLLHTISQVTYCAARLQQEPESTIVPITARYLHRELMEMRQWSSEGIVWDDAQERPQPITWVRSKPDDFQIDTDEDMTDVTAEAWRIAVIIYLQCRLLRLPRHHPDVLSNMSDLAKCISIMPTSGSHFTAQAPLLPVFFLGLLAASPEHENVSRAWFEAVVRTPVRSSVPPLYQALKRIWTWIDTAVETPSTDISTLSKSIGMRSPWWEDLVAHVHDKEEETLCLT